MKKKRYSEDSPSARVQDSAVLPRGGTAAIDHFEEIEEIRSGFPTETFYELQELLGVNTALLAGIIGLPLRTLQRRKEEGRLSKDESDRLDRVRTLLKRAADTFESTRAARDWLTRPQMGLAGFVPLELADTGAGIREVENLLGRIDYGVYA